MKVRTNKNIWGEDEIEVVAEPGDTLGNITPTVEACIAMDVIWGVDMQNASPELRNEVVAWVNEIYSIGGEPDVVDGEVSIWKTE